MIDSTEVVALALTDDEAAKDEETKVSVGLADTTEEVEVALTMMREEEEDAASVEVG